VHDEMEFLKVACSQNGYSDWQIFRALNHPERVTVPNIDRDSVTFLLYIGLTFSKINRMLFLA
jgi:hypothetical protein